MLNTRRGCSKLLKNVSKSKRKLAQLAEKIENDETTAKNAMEFYRILAENCNAEAQYELGKLHLDERFYDLSEAARWIEYAAFQGYKDAVEELKNLEIDDDGRYDAWS